jgi:hypothetical protein
MLSLLRLRGNATCQRFWWKTQKERDCLKDLGEDAGVLLRWTLRTYDGIVWSSHPVRDKEKWRAVVNTVMNLAVPYVGNF